jgi:hypothetical protein
LPGESRFIELNEQQQADKSTEDSSISLVLSSARDQLDMVGNSHSDLLKAMLDHPPAHSCRVRFWNPQVPIGSVDHGLATPIEHIASKPPPVEMVIADQRLILLGPFFRGWDPTMAMLVIHDERLASVLLDQSRRDAPVGSAWNKSFYLGPTGPWHRFIESKLRRAKKSIDCISVEPERGVELHRAWKEGVTLRGIIATDSQLNPTVERSLADVESLSLVEANRVGQGGASLFILDRERTLITFSAQVSQPLGGINSANSQPNLAIELTDPNQVQESIRWIDRQIGEQIARRSHRLRHSLR